MNWIKKVLNIGEKIKKVIRDRPSKEDVEKSNWTTCCAGPILKTELQENQWVCKSCGKHHRISCKNRFDLFFGKNNYEIIDTPIPNDDPLGGWIDNKPYTERLKKARKETGQNSAVLVATGKINGIDITTAAINFNYIAGSIGQAEGEAIIYAAQHAIDNNQAFVYWPSSGGMRMMESMFSLSQMARTTLAVNELKKKKLPFIVVFCDPVMGGTTASIASLGDILISEPGCLIGFAGRRVIEATVKEKLEDNFQKAERVLECGFIDLIIERKDLREKIATLLKILLKKNSVESAINIDETTENTRSISPIAS
jgi:acetyl-CoA carboxylase carboxyl transferase subunit beta